MTLDNLQELINTTPNLAAYFSYPECGVCTALKPKIIEIISEYPDVNYQYINIHESPEISGQLLIFAAPTVVIFQDGREIKRFSRQFSIREFEDFLKKSQKPTLE